LHGSRKLDPEPARAKYAQFRLPNRDLHSTTVGEGRERRKQSKLGGRRSEVREEKMGPLGRNGFVFFSASSFEVGRR
jgi:hypothetical protein